MTIIPINGSNTRMGGLFKTPKHLLMIDGVSALKRTVDYMSQFGEVLILAGKDYYGQIPLDVIYMHTVTLVRPTNNVIETIFQGLEVDKTEDLFLVDCDIVPIELKAPRKSTVFVFNNENGPNHYSNFDIENNTVIGCNEKGEKFDWAGAGVYYFESQEQFISNSHGCESVAEVIEQMTAYGVEVLADMDNKIERIGTLPDITGGFTENIITPTITKTGNTVRDEVKWYKEYEDKNDIPRVQHYHVNHGDEKETNVMTIDFLKAEGPLNIYSVIDLVEKYRTYRPMNILTFDVYRDRIKRHLSENEIHGAQKLIEKLYSIDLSPTFCHGDLGVTNIIQTKTGPKLIDPLYSDYKFGSYILDYAKLLFTLKFYANDLGNFNLLYNEINAPNIDILIASECVRVCTYNKKFNFIAENLIHEL